MEFNIIDRLQHAWNGFMNRDPTGFYTDLGPSSSYRPDRVRLTRGNERSLITSVFNRIALDVASIDLKHVRLDAEGRYIETIDSHLNNCLTLEANIDQNYRDFMKDVVLSMFDEGCVAVVPTKATLDPSKTESYDIGAIRTAKIIDWYPEHVKVRIYNEQLGRKEDVVVPKKCTPIIENPLYQIVNEPNSTVQRLIRKLNLLDVIDEQSSSGKLDLIIQLPYIVKSEARKRQANERRKDIANQLANSKYGIAYTDGTEKITQLNRPVENNLMNQIKYLTELAFSQLGITQAVLDGTANEVTMLNYYNRTIEPIVSVIALEYKRKWLSKTARAQHQSIEMFRDPFKLVPISQIADIADKLTRNEIATSNEIRQKIGWKPSKDPKADELRNSNIRTPNGGTGSTPVTTEQQIVDDQQTNYTEEIQNE